MSERLFVSVDLDGLTDAVWAVQEPFLPDGVSSGSSRSMYASYCSKFPSSLQK